MTLMAFILAALLGPASGTTGTGPTPYTAAIQQARDALARQDASAGLVWVDRALRANPAGLDALILLGRTQMRLEQYDTAAAAFQRAADLSDPGSVENIQALFGKADALARQEKNLEAIDTLHRILQASPYQTSVHHDLGKIALALGKLDEAVAQFRLELALAEKAPPGAAAPAGDSSVGSSWEGLGIAAYKMGDDKTALKALRKAPGTIDALYYKGLALARQGRHEEAARELRRVLEQDPDHRGVLQNLARCDAALGNDTERARMLSRFESLYRQDEEARSVRRRVRGLRKKAEKAALAEDFDAASAALREAARLAPDDLDILMDLGRWEYRSGHPQASERRFREVLEADPLRADAHYRIGRLLAERGDMPAAAAALERAAQVSPMTVAYHVHLARTYLRMHRSADGVRELRLAQRLNPKDPRSFFNLGLALAQAGQLREAVEQLQEASRLGHPDPRIHQVLSRIYRHLGDTRRSEQEQAIYERLVREGKSP